MGVIEVVGVFSGDLAKDRIKYERAQNNVEQLIEEISPLEKALCEATGFNKFNLPPQGVHEKKIPENDDVDVQFLLDTHARTKTPSYKNVVSGMKGYLNGILFIVSQGSAITGVRKENDMYYMSVNKVKEAFDIIVGGELESTLEYNIKYIISGPLAKEKTLKRLVIEEKDRSILDQDNFSFYVRAQRILNDDSEFIDAYESKIKEKVPKEKEKKTVQVSGTRGYTAKKTKRIIPPYGNAVRILVNVPVDSHPREKGEMIPVGELNQLIDANINYEDKVEMFQHYDLIERDVRNKPVLFVSIKSIYNRLDNLLGIDPTETESYRITPKEIIK